MTKTGVEWIQCKQQRGWKQMDDLELVSRVFTMFMNGHGWSQGSNALNALGLPCPPTSDNAVCWCLRGAAIHVLQADHRTLVHDLHTEHSEVSKQIARAFGFKTNA